MLAVDEIRQQLGRRCPVVREVDSLPKGVVRIETGLQYPDGSHIDVFVADNAPLLAPIASSKVRLTDLGHTTGWLLDMNVRPWLSRKRQAFVSDVLRQHGAAQEGGELVLDCEVDQLPTGVLRLAQVCLRVADLMFTRRSSLQTAFTEDVEEVLADAEVSFDKDVELTGRKGPVRVDYFVRGPRVSSALLALSAMNAQSAHNAANEIFRRWYDLQSMPGNDFQNVTLYDDRQTVYRDEDLHRLEDFSIVLPFSEKQALVDLLVA